MGVCLVADGIETVELDDPAAGYVVTGVDVGAAQLREVVSPRPMADGTVDRTRFAGSRSVTLNVTFVESPSSRQVLLDRVAPFLRPGQESELVLETDPGLAPRVLQVRAADWSAPWSRPGMLTVSFGFVTVGTPWFLSQEWQELRLAPEGSEPGRTYDESMIAAAEAVDFPGAGGSFLSAANTGSWDTGTGRLTVEFEIEPDDPTPTADQVVVARHLGLSDHPWKIAVTTTGALELTWDDVIAGTTRTHTTAAAAVVAGRKSYRVELEPDNGASEAEARFYSADSLDGPWSSIGVAVTSAGAGELVSSSADLFVSGSDSGTVDPYAGLVYGVRISGGVPASLMLDGTAGTSADTPNTPDLRITGDIDIRWSMTPDDATPDSQEVVASLWSGTSLSWQIVRRQVGSLSFGWSDGGVTTFATTGGNVVLEGHYDYRITHDVDNGSGGTTTKFYRAPAGGTLVEVASINTAGAAGGIDEAIDAPLRIGSRDTSAVPYAGEIHALSVRDGIGGTVVADVDFADATAGATSITDSTGRVWTLNGNAQIVGGETVGAGWVVDDLNAGVTSWFGEAGEAWSVSGGTVVTGGSTTTIVDQQAGVELTGVAGSYLSTPDTAALDITGDIDIRVDLTLDDWAPGSGNPRLLLSKYSTNAGYWLQLNADGRLRLNVGTGSSEPGTLMSAGTGLSGSGRKAIRVTLDLVSGEFDQVRTMRVYTASAIDGAWTLIDENSSNAATSIAAGTGDLILGTNAGDGAVGWTRVAGRYHAVEIRDGIGGTVATSWRGVDLTDGATSFTDDTGKLWTVAANATVVNDTVVIIDEEGRAYDRTYPFAEPSLVPAINGGDVPVDWQATIYGPLTGVTLVNTTTGDQIALPDLNILAGQNVVIDSEKRTILADNDPDASRYSEIDFAESQWFMLVPGLNMFKLTSESFSAPAQTWIRWRSAYLT